MIVLWVVIPVVFTIAVYLVIRTETKQLDEIARRQRAMKRLEGMSGSQGLSDDDDRRAGWFVDPNGRWPRRVRLIRRPTSFTGPHEPWTQEASANEG